MSDPLSVVKSTSVQNDTFGALTIGHIRCASTHKLNGSHEECLLVSLSLEEARLRDYQEGKGGSSDQAKACKGTMLTGHSNIPRTVPGDSNSHLELLIGPAITVKVGTKTPVAEEFTSWTLPHRLLSHHSVFFRGACLDGSSKDPENVIDLADDEPSVFALFVEWLYYGAYTVAPSSTLQPCTGPGRVSIDVKCWVLGNKVSCTGFKSYAMGRLYNQHVNGVFSRPISTHDVRFASENSSELSKLRQFFMHSAATNIGNQDQAHGSLDGWDNLFVEYSDLRRLFLVRLRFKPTEWHFMKDKTYYVREFDAS